MLISNKVSMILLKSLLHMPLALIFILNTSYFTQSYPNKLWWRLQFRLTTIYSDLNFREDFKYMQYRIFYESVKNMHIKPWKMKLIIFPYVPCIILIKLPSVVHTYEECRAGNLRSQNGGSWYIFIKCRESLSTMSRFGNSFLYL